MYKCTHCKDRGGFPIPDLFSRDPNVLRVETYKFLPFCPYCGKKK